MTRQLKAVGLATVAVATVLLTGVAVTGGAVAQAGNTTELPQSATIPAGTGVTNLGVEVTGATTTLDVTIQGINDSGTYQVTTGEIPYNEVSEDSVYTYQTTNPGAYTAYRITVSGQTEPVDNLAFVRAKTEKKPASEWASTTNNSTETDTNETTQSGTTGGGGALLGSSDTGDSLPLAYILVPALAVLGAVLVWRD